MGCRLHSNSKGVESKPIDDDNRSRPGQDWDWEHTRTRLSIVASVQQFNLFLPSVLFLLDYFGLLRSLGWLVACGLLK